MAKAKIQLKRSPPKRTITKQQAIRHLIHCACRMIAAREDPFAIHLLIQSADKLLIDLAKKRGKKLIFDWDDLIKPEHKTAVIKGVRETYNFFKHADKDHDKTLHVANIAVANVIHLRLCIENYHDLFKEATNHMELLVNVAKIIRPGSVHPSNRAHYDAAISKIQEMTFAQYLKGWWDDGARLKKFLPNLLREKAEDLQDTHPLYDTRISDLRKLA